MLFKIESQKFTEWKFNLFWMISFYFNALAVCACKQQGATTSVFDACCEKTKQKTKKHSLLTMLNAVELLKCNTICLLIQTYNSRFLTTLISVCPFVFNFLGFVFFPHTMFIKVWVGNKYCTILQTDMQNALCINRWNQGSFLTWDAFDLLFRCWSRWLGASVRFIKP